MRRTVMHGAGLGWARAGVFVAGLWFPASAFAGVVVWLEGALPDAKILERADVKTGGTQHVGGQALLFPPAPVTAADDAAYEALRKQVAEGKKSWNDFEVEYGIAVRLEEALSKVDVIRSERDFDEIVSARLFEGAAISVAFEPGTLHSDERGEAFRIDQVGSALNKPWGQAFALDPDRTLVASDVADGASFPSLRAERELWDQLAAGELTLSAGAVGLSVVVDGRPVDSGLTSLQLAPGQHYIHVLQDGMISGRAVVDVPSGGAVSQPLAASEASLAAAREKVLQGTTTGMPEDIKAALGLVAKHYGNEQLFIGAVDDGRIEVLPYSYGAELLKQRPVTFVLNGELGGGAMISSIFRDSDGQQVTAPTASGSLGFEFGVYNGVILGGADLVIHPGNSIAYGKTGAEENVDTSVSMQPWGGVGVYILRPTGLKPTLLLAGTYTWMHPSHLAPGGRVALGVPLKTVENTWFRVALGGSTAGKSMWDEGAAKTPMHEFFLRFGFAARL